MNLETRIRWWPAAVIVAGTLAALAWIWGPMAGTGQDRVVATMPVAVLAPLLLLLWLVLLSRGPRRVRVGVALGVLGLAALGAALFEIRGVSGDLVPVLGPRWAREPPPPEVEVAMVDPAPSATVAPTAPEPGGPPAPPVAPPASTPPTAGATAPATGAGAAVDADPHPAEPAPRASLAAASAAPSYPAFLGPRRDSTVPGVRLARDWERRPPELVWRREVGAGWAGFAVADGQAITQEQRGGDELVVSYELASGRVQWVHADGVRFEEVIAGVGPRAVPAIAGERVFTVGATGLLSALDRRSGRLLWQRDLITEHDAKLPQWGKSCSPLVVGDRVVVSAGGREGRSLVAYDAASGELAWHAGDDASGYSSPLPLTLAGVPQIVIFNAGSVVAHHPDDGRVLWQRSWPRGQPNVSVPVALPGDRLFVSSGYGIGGKLFQIAPSNGANGDGAPAGGKELAAELLWESPRLKAKFTNVVLHEGYLYGLDDGVLVCLDPATGERCWKRGRYGHGQVILAGDLLLVQAEDGDLVLVEPVPDEPRELARFTALDGKTWNPPALSGDLLLVRNDREAACYRLPLAE